jgi:hypothetical protein
MGLSERRRRASAAGDRSGVADGRGRSLARLALGTRLYPLGETADGHPFGLTDERGQVDRLLVSSIASPTLCSWSGRPERSMKRAGRVGIRHGTARLFPLKAESS